MTNPIRCECPCRCDKRISARRPERRCDYCLADTHREHPVRK